MAIGTVHITTVSFLEDDVYDGAIPQDAYDSAWTEDYDADDIEHAVHIIEREGLTFSATGNTWAASPDGSRIVNYATGRREEVTASLEGFSEADTAAIIDAVG